MNRADAIETVKYQIIEWLEPEDVAKLVERYDPNEVFVFKKEKFDSFCRDHFPEDYMKIADKVADAALRRDYNSYNKWIIWDDFYEVFKSADYPLEFVRNMDDFIERLVVANDHLLKKVHWADEAIRYIKDNY